MDKELFALGVIAGISVLFILMVLADRNSKKKREQEFRELRRFMKLSGFSVLDPLDRSLGSLIQNVSRFGQVVRVQEAFVLKNTGRLIARVTFAGKHTDAFFSDLVAGMPGSSDTLDFTLLYLPQFSGSPRWFLEGLLKMTHFSRLTPCQPVWNPDRAFTLYCRDRSEVDDFLSEDRLKRLATKNGCILIAEKGCIFIRLVNSLPQSVSSSEQEARQLLEIVRVLIEE